MYLSSLHLTNFRNYVRLEEHFDPGVVILFGQNAQGKTNLLESIYYLSTARSSQARTERQLIHFDAVADLPYSRVEARVVRADGPQKVTITIGIENQNGSGGSLVKRVELNDRSRKVLDFIGEINVVLFLPEDIDLIASSPSVRRRYLDATICQIDNRYCKDLAEYTRLLAQRNAQLRLMSERGARDDSGLLDVWDEQLIKPGAYIILRRQQVISRLDETALELHPRLTGERERLRLVYLPRLELGHLAAHQLSLPMSRALLGGPSGQLTLGEVTARFEEQLQANRREELARGMTLIGPHRDDVRFLVENVDMTDFGSRGQQRSAALTLKLSEVALMREKKKEPPILLLDDVMSELDESRRAFMTEMLADYPQVFLTTTDLDQFPADFLARARLLRVEQGRLKNYSLPTRS
ncbi:MAG: DNA replication and repair protein RecF [Ardenticatenaceae bacterium]|nr:DNA replication and repair protein RecF [Ardenticatenaceae bacterium]